MDEKTHPTGDDEFFFAEDEKRGSQIQTNKDGSFNVLGSIYKLKKMIIKDIEEVLNAREKQERLEEQMNNYQKLANEYLQSLYEKEIKKASQQQQQKQIINQDKNKSKQSLNQGFNWKNLFAPKGLSKFRVIMGALAIGAFTLLGSTSVREK